MSGDKNHKKPRKVDLAYEELRRLIVTLELAPGAVIDERQLVERLDIGRTPVREAIQRLVHEGMIVHVPRRGSWVSPLSFTEMQQLNEARRMLEVECARLAAERMSPEMLESLREQVQESGPEISAGDGTASVYVDQHFHLEIARATGNQYLVRMLEHLQHELMRYWYVSANEVGELHIIVSHHLAILDAISTGDPAIAERAMEDHITLLRERLSALVSGSNLAAGMVSSSVEHYVY